MALAAVLLAAASATATTPPAASATVAQSLAGSWLVDLSVKPGENYVRPMDLELKPDGTVNGLFYQSTIDAGRWKIDRNRICISFRTHDDNGPYHSAACLRGERVEGQTWAEGRNFLFNWNATRVQGSK